MPTNILHFNRQMALATAKLTGPDVVDFQVGVAVQALNGVVLETPVRTGHARFNWQLSIGAPVDSVLEGVDPSGQITISNAVAELTQLKPFQVIFLSNNVEYIIYLEEGTPKIAPFAMVARTIEALRDIVVA